LHFIVDRNPHQTSDQATAKDRAPGGRGLSKPAKSLDGAGLGQRQHALDAGSQTADLARSGVLVQHAGLSALDQFGLGGGEGGLGLLGIAAGDGELDLLDEGRIRLTRAPLTSVRRSVWRMRFLAD